MSGKSKDKAWAYFSEVTENGVTKYKDMYGGTKLHAKNIVYMKVCCCPSLSQQLPT